MTTVVTDDTVFVKHPEARKDYQFDWSAWLGNDDTISSASVTSSDSSLFIDDIFHDSTTVTVWLKAGTIGEHKLSCKIVTAAGRIEIKTVDFNIKNT